MQAFKKDKSITTQWEENVFEQFVEFLVKKMLITPVLSLHVVPVY